MNEERHVIAVFDSPAKADLAFGNLDTIAAENLSMLVNHSGMDHHFKIDETKSKTAEGVGYGAVLGGLAAGLGVAAAGIASVTVPGAIFISGPLAVSLAAGTAGAAVGGLTGGLIGLGIPEDEVKLVEKDISAGSILIAANNLTSEQQIHASEVFKKAGAIRVH
jgi:hypothetical protein